MKYYKIIILLFALLLLSGCGEDDEGAVSATGWHFQGRDCLACHNVDLGVDKNLVVAGTLFKSSTVSDVNDLANMCDADLAIEFLDSSFSVAYSTADFFDADSKGNDGRGNVFLLDRLFDTTINGAYTVRIVERLSGLTMAQSSNDSHSFSGTSYSIDNPTDFSNRLSCNACHNGGVTSYLSVQFNSDLCK